MTCQEFVDLLATGDPLNENARGHTSECEGCGRVLEALDVPALAPDPERVQRMAEAARGNWKPVRPMLSDRNLTLVLLFVFVAAGIVAPWPLGYSGFRAMDAWHVFAYFGIICAGALLAAGVIIQQMIPGAVRRVNEGASLVGCAIALAAVVLILFRANAQFIHGGEPCLRLGSNFAAASAIVLWLVVRRGLFRSAVHAGACVGFLSGLAGVAALAAHCPVMISTHILIWHLPVIAISTGAGALIGALARFRTNKQFSKTVTSSHVSPNHMQERGR